ncbi:MAG: hypothetical protein ACE5ER_10415 [Nitrospinaceae bacterium]
MRPAEWGAAILAAVLCQGTAASAEPPEPAGETREEVQGNPPSMEFLEFLGEWEDEDGEWMDPIELEDMEILETPTQDEPKD